MLEKIWAVVLHKGGEITSVLAFDHEADANNFAQEMEADGSRNSSVFQTTLSRRLVAGETTAHIELPEFNTECIECLADLPEATEEKQEAASKYFREHRDDLQKNAQEMVDEYIKKTITDFFCEDRMIPG